MCTVNSSLDLQLIKENRRWPHPRHNIFFETPVHIEDWLSDWCLGGQFELIKIHTKKMYCFIYRLRDERTEERLLYCGFIYFCRTTMHHFEQLLSSNDATVFNST